MGCGINIRYYAIWITLHRSCCGECSGVLCDVWDNDANDRLCGGTVVVVSALFMDLKVRKLGIVGIK